MAKEKIYNVLLDTMASVQNPSFSINTNDLKTVKLSILINQDGEPLDLTGATVRLAIKKPDRTTVLQDATIVDPLDGTCEIILNTQAYVVRGDYEAEVMVYYGTDTVAVTSNFRYTAKKGILSDDTVESTNEWQSITQAIADTQAILDDLQTNGTGVDAQARADIATHTTQLAEKASITYVDDEITKKANGAPKGVYTTVSALQTAFPTGDTNNYLVTGNVAEVASLNITSAPTSAGNVTVTLNGVATNISVTAGVAEVASLTISAIPTTAGNVTVTLNGVATTIAVDPTTDTTTDLVATKIRNTTFTGWTTGGTGSTITFTATSVGVKTDATYSVGSTGATGTMSTTTQGVDADTTTSVATKIRGTTFSGWTTGGTGTTVTFTATTTGSKTDSTYSAGTTGATGAMSTTTQGIDPDGKWYYWNGLAWTAGGTYQSTGIADGGVVMTNLSDRIVNSMSNMLKAFDLTLGTINGSTGQDGTTQSNTRLKSGYIKVKTGDVLKYILPSNPPSGLNLSIYLMDSTKTLTSTLNYAVSKDYTFTSDGYCRLYFAAGTTDLTNYKDSFLNAVTINNIDFNNYLVNLGYKFNANDYFKSGKNLFNKAIVYTGFLNSNGTINTDGTTYYTSDFIPIKANQSYIGKMLRKLAIYDSSKNVIQFIDNNPSSDYTFTPTADGFIRISFSNSYLDSMQIEKGSTLTTYEAFYYDVIYPNSNSTSNPVDTANNPLYGEILLNIGDSIARGAYNGDVGYADLIATNNSMNVYNYAISGATIGDYTATDPTRSCVQKQISDFIAQHPTVIPEYILLEGYANDINLLPLGSKTSGYTDTWDKTTFCGGLETILNTLKTTFMASKLIFVCVHNMSSRDATTQKTFHDAAVDICKKWSVPVVDLYSEGGLNTWITNMKTTYTDTGTHPTGEAYNLFYVPPIEAKMKSL
ncbi:BppU family phage baseplate upper protein [Bacillus sp. ISL-40]|uniref:SGNH/GDSL hydrolase family protein n=1 Tax=Bacillus sp. ISL-40 TaxID=2819126 RepID=UPI001BE54FDF|nr:SGNH/GDSL hydrolase family protein [Bacillus sp. ISL-40]MBT2696337.1 BppU family phage baseplate upper protein [Bacillus sp. ISL-40]